MTGVTRAAYTPGMRDMLRSLVAERIHTDHRAKLVPFAGFAMPISYGSITAEHLAVRNGAGIFDVSHMGEARVVGPDAHAFLDRITPNDVSMLTPGKAQYSMFLNDDGGIIDDVIIYMSAPDDYLVVLNASNVDTDLAWMTSNATGRVLIDDISSQTCLFAVQGPQSEPFLSETTPADIAHLQRFAFIDTTIDDVPVRIARTGYTGDDGFEIFVGAEHGAAVLAALVERGDHVGIILCGLGARDSLRIEAGLPLYGQELRSDISPLEAGLKWVVKMEKGDFIGRDALHSALETGILRTLVGLEMKDRTIPRTGQHVVSGGEQIGAVTSGTYSPFLDRSIGLALVDTASIPPDGVIEVDVRGVLRDARLTEIPFFHRSMRHN